MANKYKDKIMGRNFLWASLFVLISGCTPNGHTQFYRPFSDVRSLSGVEVLREGQEPTVYSTTDPQKDIRAIETKNFQLLGYSNFEGPFHDIGKVKSHATLIGATTVLWFTNYKGSSVSTIPWTVPNTTTSYTSGTANVYGTYGSAYGSYNSTTTSYGNTTIPINVTRHRYTQAGYFFVKRNKIPRLGLRVVNLTPELKKEIERNKGAFVDVVVEGSSAYDADMFFGDIILKIDGVEVRDAAQAGKLFGLIRKNADSTIFMILRNGKEQEIKIGLAH